MFTVLWDGTRLRFGVAGVTGCMSCTKCEAVSGAFGEPKKICHCALVSIS